MSTHSFDKIILDGVISMHDNDHAQIYAYYYKFRKYVEALIEEIKEFKLPDNYTQVYKSIHTLKGLCLMGGASNLASLCDDINKFDDLNEWILSFNQQLNQFINDVNLFVTV